MVAKNYKIIKINKKCISEHRHIIQQDLGRKLKTSELVHHKNENIKDNRLENLEVLGIKKHNNIHHRVKRIELKCNYCNKIIKRTQKYINWLKQKNIKNMYCSKKCVGKSHTMPRFIEIDKIVIKGLKKGMTGYQIAKENSLNRMSVYNHIKIINKKN